ncbi:murein biosynthesis integral membrane protein MurJ [Derxia lacustris]|uniref:murein biosynthesis integral membrane protein MurJ n=1 Tax=Derxia lacustris TaxID=764842 RepID=UPI000A16D4DD|nr:murein biosynthesis integral membrane protein MurJ [Derxia lacustris]
MNLLKTLATVSGLTLLSRISGLIRDLLVARLFGASLMTDAFFLAFSLPNLLRRLFAEGAFSQAFVPILGEYKGRRSESETRSLIDDVATILAWILVAVTALGVLAAPLLIWVVAPGFSADPPKYATAVGLLRIMFPYIGFISLVALAGGILNTWARFSVPAFTPVLLNLSFIGSMLLFARGSNPSIEVLAWAVLGGGVLQLAFQIPALRRVGMLPRIRLDLRAAWSDAGVRRVLRQMGPAVLGVSVAQISLVINRVFQSFLGTGSISWLFYADRLMEFPTGMLGVGLGTILLPYLSRAHAAERHDDYNALLDWGLRLACLLALPAAVALMVLALPLIATMFHHGRFSAEDAVMSADALRAYAVGLPGLILVKVLAPGFYARQDLRTPVRIALLVLLATQAMNVAFIGPLKHAGLALAIGLGACINAGFLFTGLRKRGIYRPLPGWGSFWWKVTLALLALGASLHWASAQFDWLRDGQAFQRVGALALVVSGGGAIYLLTLLVLGFRPKDFKRRV